MGRVVAITCSKAGFASRAFNVCATNTCHGPLKSLASAMPFVGLPYHAIATCPGAPPATNHGNTMVWLGGASTWIGADQPGFTLTFVHCAILPTGSHDILTWNTASVSSFSPHDM